MIEQLALLEVPSVAPVDEMLLPHRTSPSLFDGTSSLWQCSWCGALLEIHHETAKKPLGDCPACQRPNAGWWEQTPWWSRDGSSS